MDQQARGLLLAAGSGRRMGGPKALLRDDDGTAWLARAVAALRDGGCDRVSVVLGAQADAARELVPAGCDVAVAHDWSSGMGASLRRGLAATRAADDLVVVSLVDLPDVTAAVVRRVLVAGDGRGTLARAAYAGRLGHPVLIGRDHWPAVTEVAVGDRGARDLLARSDVHLVECGDLATGRDIDRPADRPANRP